MHLSDIVEKRHVLTVLENCSAAYDKLDNITHFPSVSVGCIDEEKGLGISEG